MKGWAPLAAEGRHELVKLTPRPARQTGEFQSDLMPTVGFMMHKFQKGKVRIKLWDLGGQQKFRGMWERYCRGVNVIVFVVDSADVKMFQPAKKELTDLLSKPTLTHIPLLVLFNKSDLADAQPPAAIAAALDLGSINDGRDVVFYSVSCKSQENIDTALDFLIKRSKQ